jgi:hypothetical protein
MFVAMSTSVSGDVGRESYRIAVGVVNSLLSDQIARADLLNGIAGVFAGLGGVVTTLAGIVIGLDEKIVGKCGESLAGLSVVFAVIALFVKRPGREPRDLRSLVHEILSTNSPSLIEDVLLETDAQAATRNDARLRVKTVWVVLAAMSLALAISLLVVGMLTS